MSRHTFKTNLSIGTTQLYIGDQPAAVAFVTAGWDRSMQTFFLEIETEHEVLYDSIFDDKGNITLNKDINFIANILDGYNIKPPEGFFENIESDKINNIGNKIVKY